MCWGVFPTLCRALRLTAVLLPCCHTRMTCEQVCTFCNKLNEVAFFLLACYFALYFVIILHNLYIVNLIFLTTFFFKLALVYHTRFLPRVALLQFSLQSFQSSFPSTACALVWQWVLSRSSMCLSAVVLDRAAPPPAWYVPADRKHMTRRVYTCSDRETHSANTQCATDREACC